MAKLKILTQLVSKTVFEQAYLLIDTIRDPNRFSNTLGLNSLQEVHPLRLLSTHPLDNTKKVNSNENKGTRECGKC
jgi:hypothetical protein